MQQSSQIIVKILVNIAVLVSPPDALADSIIIVNNIVVNIGGIRENLLHQPTHFILIRRRLPPRHIVVRRHRLHLPGTVVGISDRPAETGTLRLRLSLVIDDDKRQFVHDLLFGFHIGRFDDKGMLPGIRAQESHKKTVVRI